MYVHHIRFGVRADRFEDWAVHARNSLGAFSRMDGLVLIRLLRDLDDPTSFVSQRAWRAKEDSDRALASPELAIISTRARAGKFGEGFQTVQSEYQLWDQVFGREGLDACQRPGAFVSHISAYAPGSEQQPLWPAYVRNFASVLARQRGLVSYEIARDFRDPNHHLVLRTWRDRESSRISPEQEPNREVRLALLPVSQHNFYEGCRPSELAAMEVFDAAYGPQGAEDYAAFVRGLKPV